VSSYSGLLDIENGRVAWNSTAAFSNVPTECISGYQYSINGANTTNVIMTTFTLDRSLTEELSCGANILTIRPIVMVENSVLNNVVLAGSTCDQSNLFG